MRNIKIFPIIILTALVASFYFPIIYKDMLGKRTNTHKVYYSPVSKEFVKLSSLKGKDRKIIYSNLDGSIEYSQDEYKALLPFMYYSDLLKIDRFPKQFIAFAQDPRVMRVEKQYLKIKPTIANKKYINLHPLIESAPKYSSLKLPKDLFLLDENGINFIKSVSNTIDVKKSERFSKKFLEEGAIFPLKKAFGNPTTRKSFDEGYFVTDSKKQVFHLKMIKGEAYVKKISNEKIDVKSILVKENTKKEFYGLVLTQDSTLYLLMYDDYELVKLPLEGYDSDSMSFMLYTTPINRLITLEYIDEDTNEKVIKSIITNLDYEKLKENTYRYSLDDSKFYETLKSYIFPFELKIITSKDYMADIEFKKISINGFILSFVLALSYLVYIKLSNRKLTKHIIPSIIISILGIYAITALLLFNKFLGIRKLNDK